MVEPDAVVWSEVFGRLLLLGYACLGGIVLLGVRIFIWRRKR